MDISLLLSSLNASKNLVGLLVDERDRQKAAAIQIDLTNKIIEAQAQISEVLAAVIEKDGRLVITGGPVLTADDIRELRLADQR